MYSLGIILFIFIIEFRMLSFAPNCKELHESDNLSCNGMPDLNELPFTVSSTVTSLSLCLESSHVIRSTHFESFERLQKLEISSCKESATQSEWTFEGGFLSELDTLKELKVTGGRLKFRSPTTISQLSKLRRFYIENCVILEGLVHFQPSLETISIQNSGLKAFGELGDVPFLRELLLQHNVIVNIATNAFRMAVNLQVLDISFNRLSNLNGRLAHLKMLEDLSLEHNRVHIVTNESFQSLVSLRKLNLGHNAIANIDGVFRGLSRLEWLFLNDNLLSKLEGNAFTGLYGLLSLNLQNNRISNIGSYTFHLTPNLRWLYLRNNRLTSVPFIGAPNMEQLDLEENLLNVISADAFRSSNRIRGLSLAKNAIVVVDDYAFRDLTSLVSLNLSYNKIAKIRNKAFDDLRNVLSLRLEYNHISFDENIYYDGDGTRSLDIFRNLDSMTFLNLSHNTIEEFHSGWCPSKLNTLDLSYNRISSFDSTSAFSSIQTLNLGFNRLTTVFKNVLPTSIETAYLNDNHLIRVNRDSLALTAKLRFISLRNNLLGSLVLDRPLSGRGIVELDVLSNRFVCNCHLVWLQQVLVGRGSPFYVQNGNELTCQNRFNKTRENTLSIFSVTDPQDLMCTFSEDADAESESNIKLCFVWKVDIDDSSQDITVCDPPCPKNCTCFRSEDWTKVHAECTEAGLTSIPTELHPITTSLFLDYNNLSHLEVGDFPHFQFLFELNLTACGIQYIEVGTFSRLQSLMRLYLKGNLLQELSSDMFANLTNLVELDLSYNLFTYLSKKLFVPLVSLLELHINNNRLVQFPVWMFSSMKIYDLAIYDNPWSCDCNFTALFRRWMHNATRILRNNERIYCLSDGNPPQKVSLIAYNESSCYETQQLTALNDAQVTILATSLCVLTTIVVLAILVFIYRREMQVLIYSRYGVRLFHHNRDEDNDMNVFDAFVSYSNLDEDFIVNTLLPGLEGVADPYHLCLHHRDFVVGEFITENILNAIQHSQRTILVFSANFVQSEWCRYEFKMAHCRMLEDRRQRVIVILLGEVPRELAPEMKLYLRTNTYLTWGDRFFWEKLYFVLPEKRIKREAGDGISLLPNNAAEIS